MREYRRLALLVGIMAAVALIVVAVAFGVLYGTALQQERVRLTETARSQARLMEAMARFDQVYSLYPSGPRAATLAQIEDAHRQFRRQGLGESGEITLASRDGDRIVFLLRHQHGDVDSQEPLAWDSRLAEPMRRALSGQSGSMIGLDYHGDTVLAAYEPVGVLDLGIVAKIDLAEVRAPFVRAGWITFLVATFAVAVGAVLFLMTGEPMIRQIFESEHRFRSLFETMGTAVAIYQPVEGGADFVFKDLNHTLERTARLPRQALLGRRLSDVFPGVHALKVYEMLRRVLKTGLPESLPAQHYRDDRIDGWFESAAYRLRSGELVALFQDVSERERAIEALRVSEMRMRALIDASQDEIVLMSADGILLAVNHAAERRLARKAGEAGPIGVHVAQLLPPDVLATRMAVVEQVIASGRPGHFEESVRSQVFDYWVYPVLRPDGRVTEIALYGRDVTEMRQAERELSKLYQAIHQSPVSVMITDPAGNIEYVNPKFCEVTGYALPEVLGHNPRLLKSGHLSEAEYAELWRTISAGEVWRGELLNRRKDGSLFWELASIAPVKSMGGSITHFVAVKEDITERKAIEDQLRQAHKLEAVGQLTGGIAHDFNNLLAIIIGNLQLLERRLGDDERGRALLGDAIWSAKRGANLIDRLLAFARRQPLNPVIVDLNVVIRGMTDLLRRSLGPGIDVQERLGEDLWPVLVDRGQIENAIVNLAVNARDAMPRGGVLTLASRNRSVSEAEAVVNPEMAAGEYAEVTVADSGLGMPPEVVRRAFEPFFTTKPVGKGSGLGLSMVHGFIKQSGGHIAIASEVGHGTIVTLCFPRAVMARDDNKPRPATATA